MYHQGRGFALISYFRALNTDARMTIDEFFDLFETELRQNKALTAYHRLVNSSSRYHFRKAYMKQRLQYVASHATRPESRIWDVGCGYATSAIFFALNGHTVHGSTLEFYYEEIESRLQYWKNHGDLSKLTVAYENIFDMDVPANTYDYVVVQDTLHHLEPFHEAACLIHRSLKPSGVLLVSEENGNNIINNLKNFRRRGFNRVVKLYDERLQKHILIGNENTRSMAQWQRVLEKAGLHVQPGSIEYIRYYMPFKYNGSNTEAILAAERELALQPSFRREYFFFGLNFTATKGA